MEALTSDIGIRDCIALVAQASREPVGRCCHLSVHTRLHEDGAGQGLLRAVAGSIGVGHGRRKTY